MIAIFGGTFDPIHDGHLLVIRHFSKNCEKYGIDSVVVNPTPRNPLKDFPESLLCDRVESINDRINLDRNFVHSDEYEAPVFVVVYPYQEANAKNGVVSYTSDLLKSIDTTVSETGISQKYCLIVGEDFLSSYKKWKDIDYILSHYTIYVYPRNTKESIPEENKEVLKLDNVIMVEGETLDISSTEIRNARIKK